MAWSNGVERAAESQPAEHGGGASPSIINVSGPLMALTWVTFVLLAIVLYKVAWKPILKALDIRENSIRRALNDAAKARAETAALEARSRGLVVEAEKQGQAIVEAARATAAEAAELAAHRARAEAKAAVEATEQQIRVATEKARASLRAETVKLAVEIAGRVVGENLDQEKNRRLVKRVLEEDLHPC